ncbi:HPP family protein [Streptomyces sp. DH12]|uniref:CBS domain-containing protein n=1 Tax=Streptomyces sp. DH12 TaxID=2857010 RepID=UPI001E6531FD|nr:CBS domain-containing protein [Streptomyces sp. DH12]
MTMHAPARDAPGAPAPVEVPGPGGEPPTGAGSIPLLDRRVGDVMRTRLVAVAAEETLLVCWELFERTGERHLPVVLPDGRCAGVLDRAEVAAVCAAPAVSLSRRYAGDLARCRRCVVLRERDPVRRAVDVLDANDCDALPVVTDGGTLAGLLTAADVVAALAGRRAAPPPGTAPAPPAPYPVLPGLAPRRDTERVSPVP